MTALERRCRWLLLTYPAGYRRRRREERLGTLLEASPPGGRWPSLRDARALITGGLRVRGWFWLLSMLWVVAGAVNTGYFFYLTTKPYTWAGASLGIPGWSTDPEAVQVAVVLAIVAWLALPIPVLIAGFIRLRGWRPGNWLRAAAWVGAWVAGVALLSQASVWPAALHGLRSDETQRGETFLNTSQFDVIASDSVPGVSGQPPALDRRGLAAAGVPRRAVRLVAQRSGYLVGRVVVGEGVALGLACAQPGECQVQYGRAHLRPDPATTPARRQPREGGNRAELGELGPFQILHADRLAAQQHDEVQPPEVLVHAGTPRPDSPQPPPLAVGTVRVQRHRVIERPWRGIGNAGADNRDQPLQQLIRCPGQCQPRRPYLKVQRRVCVYHTRTVCGQGLRAHAAFRSESQDTRAAAAQIRADGVALVSR